MGVEELGDQASFAGRTNATTLVQSQEEQPKRPELIRRSRMETYCDIIKAIAAGAEKPTCIMFKSNLSWTILDSYIQTLESLGVVSVEYDKAMRRKYHLTQKGFTLLKQYLGIREDLTL
jgi:predicted transcriptional regulator